MSCESRNILFVAEAVTLAHVGRMISLANGLDRARYKPLLAWDPRFKEVTGEIQGEFFSLSSISTASFLDRLRKNTPIYDVETLDRYVKDDLELFQITKPSAVVGDFRLSLAISAAVAGIPYLNVVNAHWSPYAKTQWSVPEGPIVETFGPYVAQFIFNIARPLFFRSYATGFNRLLKKWGRPSLGPDLRNIYCAGDRTLYPDLPEVVTTENLPGSHRFLGPIIWSPSITGPEIQRGSLAAERKTIYVTMGTSGNPKAVTSILAGLAKRNLRILLASGEPTPNPAPERLELHVSPYFCGQKACEVSDLVIHNGGSGAISQCILAGVPFIGVASNLDQYSSMYFAQCAALGKTIRSDRISALEIEKVAGHLLDDQHYREKAQAMRLVADKFNASDILMEELDKLW